MLGLRTAKSHFFKDMSMKQSILSYPVRGDGGDSRYRGNCAPQVIHDFIDFHEPRSVCDPACGSDTTGDVVRAMQAEGRNVTYHGFDLRWGFNLLKDSLLERIGQPVDLAFFHPPYAGMIQYSGNQWGSTAHPDDLSHCPSYGDFLDKMGAALRNIYRAVARNGVYGVLIGDWKKSGEYHPLGLDLRLIAPGRIEGVAIKAQHNCMSDSRAYGGKKLCRIAHEYLVWWRRTDQFYSMVDAALEISKRLKFAADANWKALCREALASLGGKADLQAIYSTVEQGAPSFIKSRPNWQARVRATLQEIGHNVGRGVWAVAA
jgi:hypothetical protein